ncbi:MAG: metallophosphoesterase [Thermoplasmata archaeon]|nr:metallophosphoesterase [Thermoplasmata archaeon]
MPGRSFRFAHLADAHVGAWARDPDLRRALRRSVLKALKVVTERDCEFLLISGDLFHTPVPDPAEVAPVAAALRQLTSEGRRVYVIYGSHDYVAHRTSWLDVLAETGIFLRAAPEAVRAEGSRWTLPFQIDEPTGAAVAGISGRSHGLDREYFSAVDSEAFRAHPGLKIFQFHAAVEEYLPEGLRGHVAGIRRADLPVGCDYYAGGHIHYSYAGTGPEGGLLVNPGAVFGTSLPDVENAAAGRTHQGLVVISVRDGVVQSEPEFVETAPRDALKVFDIDITGQTFAQARETVSLRLAQAAAPGKWLFPRIVGVPTDGTVGALGLSRTRELVAAQGVEGIHWDLRDSGPVQTGPPSPEEPETEVVAAALKSLARELPPGIAHRFGAEGSRLRELLNELRQPIAEGESRQDYESGRIQAALTLLELRPRPAPAH